MPHVAPLTLLPRYLVHGHRHPLRPAQRRDRRPRRPRQDDPRRRHAAPDRLLRLARAHGRARHGLERPRAREGHHDPRQEHGDHVHGRARDRRSGDDQRHRHPRPRRLRRRGRARPVDGRRRRAARRRERGPAAADPLRAAQGARGRSSPSSCWSTRPTAPTRASTRSWKRATTCCSASRATCTTTCPTSTSTRCSTCRSSTRPAATAPRPANKPENGTLPDNDDLEPLFEAILEHVPAPDLRRRGAAAGVGHEPRRVARSSAASRCCASSTARSRRARRSPGCAHDGIASNARITELLKTRALERYPAESAGPGDIVAIAGFEDITIGETIADPDDVRPLPPITSTTRPSR